MAQIAKPAIMLQGTGSNVGKSMLAAGLCRALSRRGLAVRPFKPQNMSNNAAVTCDGGEIGRAQALQAQACGVPPSVHMNPVLLKPEAETGSQVIVQGRRIGSYKARDFWRLKPDLMPAVLESFDVLQSEADFIIVEGAGSAAEVNLRAGDIANMGFAEAAKVPVILIGDIDRGGVIASLIGTHTVLPDNEKAHIQGFIINRFRGDPSLFEDGVRRIEADTGWPCQGVVPWFADASRLPAEDSVGIADRASVAMGRVEESIKIAVPLLPRISNHDDLDPLSMESDVSVDLVPPGRALPGDADVIILPGSKATIADLQALRDEGWDIDIAAHVRRGGHVLGLCGGLQMLGKSISDPDGIEGRAGDVAGLGLLDIESCLLPEKRLADVTGHHVASGSEINGYEMHIGRTTGPDLARPFATIAGRPEGACSPDGRIIATYLHGIFASDEFRHHYLKSIKNRVASDLAYSATIEATLDALSEHLERHLDIDALIAIASGRQGIGLGGQDIVTGRQEMANTVAAKSTTTIN